MASSTVRSLVDGEIISQLNIVLRNKLAGINQYFLHARMMKHMGYMKLADYEYRESIQQMKYSDLLVERVLTLGGLPNMNEIGTLRIGNDVYSILQCDLEVQKNGIAIFAHAIGMCEAKGDKESADILRDINDSKHKRIEFIETQLKSIDTIGLDKYLQSQV